MGYFIYRNRHCFALHEFAVSRMMQNVVKFHGGCKVRESGLGNH